MKIFYGFLIGALVGLFFGLLGRYFPEYTWSSRSDPEPTPTSIERIIALTLITGLIGAWIAYEFF